MADNYQQLLSCRRIATLYRTPSPPPRLMFLVGPDGKGLLKIDPVYMRMYEVLICDVRSIPSASLNLNQQAPPSSHCEIQQNLCKPVCHVSSIANPRTSLSQHSLSQPSDPHSSHMSLCFTFCLSVLCLSISGAL